MNKLTVLLAGIALAAACTGGNDYEFDALYEDLPFEMPRVERPSIPARSVVLTDFGGVGDGVALNTQAFADAIASLEKQGGGKLVVPEGIWRTGPIELKSHIELNVVKDAVIVFDPDQDLYPVIDNSLITAFGVFTPYFSGRLLFPFHRSRRLGGCHRLLC